MWFLEGSQKQLLKRCSFRRDHYVRTVASAAALMASLARSSERSFAPVLIIALLKSVCLDCSGRVDSILPTYTIHGACVRTKRLIGNCPNHCHRARWLARNRNGCDWWVYGVGRKRQPSEVSRCALYRDTSGVDVLPCLPSAA